MRRITGPKDMPYAAKVVFDTVDQTWAAVARRYKEVSPEDRLPLTLTREAHEKGLGLIWCTREVIQQAAEAAFDMPVDRTSVTRIIDVCEWFEAKAALVMFPEDSMPVPAMQLPSDAEGSQMVTLHYPCRGFILRMVNYFGSPDPMLVLSPLVDRYGMLISATDILPTIIDGHPATAQVGEWREHIGGEILDQKSAILAGPEITADSFGRFISACCALMLEPNIVSTAVVRGGKKDADRGTGRIPEIRRIDLRPMRSVNVTHSSSGRVYQHRWVVRGHWRNAWHPSTGQHATTWIAPYLKGPEGAPLLTSPKVYIWNK